MLKNGLRFVLPVLLAGFLITFWLVLLAGSSRAAAPAGLPDTGIHPQAAIFPLETAPISVDEIVVGGLALPVGMTHAGDGSGRLFVIEQGGLVRIVKNGALLPEPFLNLSAEVKCCAEQGLLGLAFHPQYESNGRFFVSYTREPDGASVLAAYMVSADPNLADSLSASTILTVTQPYANHNGGQITFGPDGYLYFGLGDGGSGGDPLNLAQNVDSLLGKMLRLDVDTGEPYAIPPDNPFVGQAGLDEIWALGLRNPWRWSFDRLSGELYIGDVGQTAWEEIDYLPAAAPGAHNFGWRCLEGTHVYNTQPPCDDPDLLARLIPPIAEYSHTEGASVTGGYVYRGARYPGLRGFYFYADYAVGKIWSLTQVEPGVFSTPTLALDTDFLISSFGEDEAGELYLLNMRDGTLRRLADARGPALDLSTSQKTTSTPYADPGEVVTYTLQLINTGAELAAPVTLSDQVPAGLDYRPGTLAASHGQVDEGAAPLLTWQGEFSTTSRVTVTYEVSVNGLVNGTLVNAARLESAASTPLTLTHSLAVPRPPVAATQADFFLPGTQPDSLQDPIYAPETCAICHTEPVYARWRGSMMGQAGRDPLLWAALQVANNDAPGVGDYCLRCHVSKGWLEGRSHPADGNALEAADIEAGVSCAVCHRLVDPQPQAPGADQAWELDVNIRAALTSTVPADIPGSAMLIVDPDSNRRGPFDLGLDFVAHLPQGTYQTRFLGQDPDDHVTRARLCGSCHNVDNPLLSWDADLEQYWPNAGGEPAPDFGSGELFPIETTYDEWLHSDYVDGVYAPQFAGARPDGIVGACQDCHMPRITGLAAADGLFRDCVTTGCLPEHELVGGNAWVPEILQDSRWRLNTAADQPHLDASAAAARDMLGRAADLTVTLDTDAAQPLAVVRITNQTGHKLPTGYPEGRRMWLNLRAYDAAGQLLYESGAYDPQTAALAIDAKVYEAKQGISPGLAAEWDLQSGESFHFVLNNMVVKDNRIPPRGFGVQALATRGLTPIGANYAPGQYWDETQYTLPAGTVYVRAYLYYQTSSRAYIDFLRANGGVDGIALGQLWDSSKSPPVLMTWAQAGLQPLYLPLVLH